MQPLYDIGDDLFLDDERQVDARSAVRDERDTVVRDRVEYLRGDARRAAEAESDDADDGVAALDLDLADAFQVLDDRVERVRVVESQ